MSRNRSSSKQRSIKEMLQGHDSSFEDHKSEDSEDEDV